MGSGSVLGLILCRGLFIQVERSWAFPRQAQLFFCLPSSVIISFPLALSAAISCALSPDDVFNPKPAANIPSQQQTSGAMQSTQSNCVKVWEGILYGLRQGQPVFITRLEGHRSSSAFESLASDWPRTMEIVRLQSQDRMNDEQYLGTADFLDFQALNPHPFLAQLQEKNLCAVIELPSQTLLLSVSDKPCRLIGMLFPGDMVVPQGQV
ncbi:mediator of RNA polymerase II transcription subunit 25-like [Prosopis cineraria]|uniref:mediator of RNA polymerase II transcription subunit 25-like n=1 Tax=Prosopis cineraria TaxID=364024 RepID=UPI00240F63DD|nr:mediator of RNA polymerase II transcription subunit 25-like [Prosopis cineraria]